MAELTPLSDNLNMDDFQKKPLPGGLNALTILTYIGCVIAFLGAIWNFYNAKHAYDTRADVIEKMNSGTMPSWAKNMMPDMSHFEEMVTKAYENRIPILLLTLAATALCFIGATQMRKMKKQGFVLYTIGEILPFFTSAFFIGTFVLTGTFAYVGYAIALLFILLYAGQRKNMV